MCERRRTHVALAKAARVLNRRAGVRQALPFAILMSDAQRLPDPVAAAARLPAGAAVLLRHYEDPGRARLAQRLAVVCRRRRLWLLIAADWRLALRVGADGVHLPEGLAARLPGPPRRPRPGFVLSVAAHSPRALARAARIGADMALVSPVFATASHPGAPALGALRFAAMARAAPLAVYALGGIDAVSVRRLSGSGAAGVAGIGAVAGMDKQAGRHAGRPAV